MSACPCSHCVGNWRDGANSVPTVWVRWKEPQGPQVSVGTRVNLCCSFPDYPKSWIVLFELVLWKTGVVWLHRIYYLSQHERKTDCDSSVAPLVATVADDRGWCFIYPRKMRNTSIQSLYAHSIPPWFLTQYSVMLKFFSADHLICVLTSFYSLRTVCITRRYDKETCENA